MAGIAILAACYVLSHFYRSFLAVLSPVMSSELGLSPDLLSSALGAWFVAFALAQFPIGILLDRIGPRLTTALMFGVLAGGGGLLFTFAQSGTAIFIAMVLLGVGCAPVLMASLYIFKLTFDARRFATLMSAFIAVGLLGNILGSSPLALALEAYGWRATMGGLTAATVLLAIAVYVTVADPVKTPSEGAAAGGGFLSILRMRTIWWILPLIAVNYAVSGGLRGIWAGPYLNIIHGYDASQIGVVTLAMALAMAAGSFAIGPLDNLANSRKWVVMPFAAIGFLALLWWALNPAMSPNAMTVAVVVIGFTSMSYGVLMAHATANVPAHLAGRGVTLVNFFNMGGVGVMQWITGGVYRASETPGEPLVAFSNVLWVYTAILAAALLIYLFSRDVPPRGVS